MTSLSSQFPLDDSSNLTQQSVEQGSNVQALDPSKTYSSEVAPAENTTSSTSILIVHHETATRLMLTEFLQAEGYGVHSEDTWEAAFDQLQQQPIDLVILDLAISQKVEGGGLRQLLSLYPDTRVVMICDHCSLDDAVNAMKQGAVDLIHQPHGYLQHPLKADHICAVIAEALNCPRYRVMPIGNFDELIDLAYQCSQKRDFAQARKLIGEAMKQAPERPEYLTLLGLIAECESDRLEALKFYRAALGLDPTYQLAEDNLHRATTNLKSRPCFDDPLPLKHSNVSTSPCSDT